MTDILNKSLVLVLNRNWQAINIRTPADAFCQMATNAATALDIELAADGRAEAMRPVTWSEWITLPVRPQDNAVRTPRGAIRMPTVIVAVNFAKVPKNDNVDTEVGGVTTITYGLSNSVLAKRPSPDGPGAVSDRDRELGGRVHRGREEPRFDRVALVRHARPDTGAVHEAIIEDHRVARPQRRPHHRCVVCRSGHHRLTDRPVEDRTLGAGRQDLVHPPGHHVEAGRVEPAVGEGYPHVDGAHRVAEEGTVLVPVRAGIDRHPAQGPLLHRERGPLTEVFGDHGDHPEVFEGVDDVAGRPGRLDREHPAAAPHPGPQRLDLTTDLTGHRRIPRGRLLDRRTVVEGIVGGERPVDVVAQHPDPLIGEQAPHHESTVAHDAAAQQRTRQVGPAHLGHSVHRSEQVGRGGRVERVFDEGGCLVERVGHIGDYGNNAYLLSGPDPSRVTIIDAPGGAEAIVEAVGARLVERIVVTHAHFDHWIGFDVLRAATDAPVYAGAEETDLEASRLVRPLAHDEVLDVGGAPARVLHTPGHTPGSICLVFGGVVLTGDTLFPGGPGRTRDHAALEQEIASITARLLTLPPETLVLPGHGDATTIGAARAEYDAFASRTQPDDLHGDVTWGDS